MNFLFLSIFKTKSALSVVFHLLKQWIHANNILTYLRLKKKMFKLNIVRNFDIEKYRDQCLTFFRKRKSFKKTLLR